MLLTFLYLIPPGGEAGSFVLEDVGSLIRDEDEGGVCGREAAPSRPPPELGGPACKGCLREGRCLEASAASPPVGLAGPWPGGAGVPRTAPSTQSSFQGPRAGPVSVSSPR